MIREFRHPTNGHTQTVSGLDTLWAILFGVFYFAAKGLWRHVFIQIFVIVVFLATMGPPGIMIVLLMWFAYAIAAPSIRASSYLNAGWREGQMAGDTIKVEVAPSRAAADDSLVDRLERSSVAARSDERDCPFCAERIKKAAIKCRHCGSAVDAMKVDPPPAAPPAARVPPPLLGVCPKCDATIPLHAKECPKCTADFGSGSVWKVKPL